MGLLKGLGYFLAGSYGLFVLVILIAIVTAISFGIKNLLEKHTSLNKESITAITVFCGLLAFFILAAPTFFGMSMGFLDGAVNALIPDF